MFWPVPRLLLALSIAAAPIAATAQQAPSAAALSVQAGESTDGASQLLEGDGGAVVAIAILGIIILGAYLLSDDDGPTSP